MNTSKSNSIKRDGMFLEQASCNVCKSCWREKGKARCIYGGPYFGYIEVSGNDGSGPNNGEKPSPSPELGDDQGSGGG